MKIVFVLMEIDPEGVNMLGIYENRKAALKSALMLMRNKVADSLNFYRLTGDKSAEYCYRNSVSFGYTSYIFSHLCVVEEKVWSEQDLEDKQKK
jgi:hypothetical protein